MRVPQRPDELLWVRLDEAADLLKVPRQALAEHLKGLGREVLRVEHEGRWSSFVRRGDVGLTPGGAAVEAEAPRDDGHTIWAKVRALEGRCAALEEQLRVAHHERAEHEARARLELDARELAERESERARFQARQLERLLEDERAHAGRLEAEVRDSAARCARQERELSLLKEVEAARERYCDRIERELAAQRRAG